MNALLISPKDNVAVVTCAVEKGNEIEYKQQDTVVTMNVTEDIPVYHKVAIKDIEADEKVMKYGYVIGKAIRKIAAGEHVHCHNVISVENKEEA